MKKKFYLFTIFILTILIFPIISAAEIQFTSGDDTFDSGETLLAVASGNFIDQVTRNNVFFYRDHVRIPVDFDVIKSNVDNDFYIYGILVDKSEGNYSIRIENVRYMQGTQVVDDDLIKNFTITQNVADFSVNPGTLIASENFQFELQNLQVSGVTIQVDVPDGIQIQGSSSVDVSSGEIREISFLLDSEAFPNNAMETISLSSDNTNYDFPLFVFGSESNGTPSPDGEQQKQDIEFQPDVVSVTLATDSNTKRIIYLQNTGEETIEDITFFVSPLLEPYVTIFPDEIDDIESGSAEKIEIEIISDMEEVILEGEIIAQSGNVSASFTLILDFTEGFVPTEEQPEGEEVTLTTCSQLSGTICSETQECSGETEELKDGLCCLAQCQDVEESSTSSRGKIIGWSIIVAVVLLLLWFFKKKYRGVKKKLPFGLKN